MSNFQISTIEENCELSTGFPFKSKTFLSNGEGIIRLARGDNIKEGFFQWGEKEKRLPAILSEYEKYELLAGDVLVSMDGSKVGKNWVSVSEDDLPCYLVQRVCRLRGKSNLLQGLIKYLICGKEFRNYIDAVKTGTSIPHISLDQIKKFPIFLPPLQDQKAIVNILGTLDKKIELNKKTNENLENIAKAVFKSWFIDFDPVRAKAEGRTTGFPEEINDLFPNSFEDSELGMIPTDWDIKKIADWGHTLCGKTPSTKNASYFGNDYMFVTIPDLHKGLHVTSSSKGLSKLGAELQSKKLLSKGSVLVSCIATPGLIGVLEESCFTNQQINSITPKNKNHTWFIAFYLLMNNDLLLSFGGGGSVFFNLSKSKFDSIEILSPPEKIIDKFNIFAAPLMDKCFALKKEISFLSNIKDTLLPKLISGDLRIQDAAKMIEEVGT